MFSNENYLKTTLRQTYHNQTPDPNLLTPDDLHSNKRLRLVNPATGLHDTSSSSPLLL